jgi:hypothetical protein
MRKDALGIFWRDEPPVRTTKADKHKRTPPEPTWLEDSYLPGLDEAQRFEVQLFTDMELYQAAQQKKELIFDIECYKNYFLIAFREQDLGRVVYFEMYGEEKLAQLEKFRWVMENFIIIGFNSLSYDIPMATLALGGKSCAELKAASDAIIQEGARPSDLLRSHKLKKLTVDHIDLIEVAPLRASLKIYAGRLHAKRMQDLPFAPYVTLSPEQRDIVRWYCINDLVNTELVRGALREQLKLRESMSREYNMDLRSKSDAQIAEAVIGEEVHNLNGSRPQRPEIEIGTCYKYKVPHFIKFESSLLQWALELIRTADFVVSEHGNVGMPPLLAALKLQIAGSIYRMGVGGLHSSEQSVSHVAGEDMLIIDRDVVSYYPMIILNQELYPKHLGRNFLKVYKRIVDRRIAAKRNGDKVVADSLKITINGSFGKLGSKYSILYAPDLLIQVTVTGQLSLLMLIERLELAGISVVSANTDGIVIKCHKAAYNTVEVIIKKWEQDTNFETEETRYSALYSRDVNNYIAVYAEPIRKKDGTFTYAKTKGVYSTGGMSKNPTNDICAESVVKFLSEGTPINHTVRGCTNIRKFMSVRAVKGGAVKVLEKVVLPKHATKEDLVKMAGYVRLPGSSWVLEHESGVESAVNLDRAYEDAKRQLAPPSKTLYLGKSVRWYYGVGPIAEGELVYAINGNKVPRSDGAIPMMDIPEAFPTDIDYQWYEDEAYKMLEEINYQEVGLANVV